MRKILHCVISRIHIWAFKVQFADNCPLSLSLSGLISCNGSPDVFGIPVTHRIAHCNQIMVYFASLPTIAGCINNKMYWSVVMVSGVWSNKILDPERSMSNWLSSHVTHLNQIWNLNESRGYHNHIYNISLYLTQLSAQIAFRMSKYKIKMFITQSCQISIVVIRSAGACVIPWEVHDKSNISP